MFDKQKVLFPNQKFTM